MHSRLLMRRALSRWSLSGRWRALQCWRDRAAAHAASASRAAAAFSHFTSHCRACAHALRQWAPLAQAWRERRASLAALANQRLRRGLLSWMTRVGEVRLQQAVVAAWASRGERRALNAWVEKAALRRWKLAAVRHGLELLAGKEERLALMRWADRLREVDARERGVRHWSSRHLSTAWGQWVACASSLLLLSLIHI